MMGLPAGRVVMRTLALCFALFALAGCRDYWHKPNGTLGQFATDHRECLEKGDPVPDKPGFVIIDEGVFRRCMAVRGWQREEHQAASVPAGRFRGVEDFELRPEESASCPANWGLPEHASAGSHLERLPCVYD